MNWNLPFSDASWMLTATATVIPTIGLLPAPNARGITKKKPSPNLFFVSFKRVFVCAFVDTMWTRFFVHAYMIPYDCFFVNGNHQIKIQILNKQTKVLTKSFSLIFHKVSHIYFYDSLYLMQKS